jgi:hypothetical protein
LSGALTTAGGFLALAFGLAIIDQRVRHEFVRTFTGAGPSTELVSMAARLHDFAFVVFEAIKHQSAMHAPLVVLITASLILFAAMLKT